jgi:hypothetical protein
MHDSTQRSERGVSGPSSREISLLRPARRSPTRVPSLTPHALYTRTTASTLTMGGSFTMPASFHRLRRGPVEDAPGVSPMVTASAFDVPCSASILVQWGTGRACDWASRAIV